MFFVNYIAENCLCTWTKTLCLLITKNIIKAIVLRLITNGCNTPVVLVLIFRIFLADIPSAEIYLKIISVSSEYCHESREFKRFKLSAWALIHVNLVALTLRNCGKERQI